MDNYRGNINGPNQSNFNQNVNSSGVRGGKIKTDSISKGLEKLLNEIEDKYKLDKEVKNRAQKSCKLKTLPIRAVHEYIISTVRLVPANVRRSRNIEVSGIMGSVLYLSHLMEFRNLCRVDFRDHPGITSLVGLLGKFYKYKDCNYEKSSCLNAILESLELYESISMMRINTKLSYKLLRVFYLMVVYDNLIDASAIAKLILEQVSLTMNFLVNDGNRFPNRNRNGSMGQRRNSRINVFNTELNGFNSFEGDINRESTVQRRNNVEQGRRQSEVINNRKENTNRFRDDDGFSDETNNSNRPVVESRSNRVDSDDNAGTRKTDNGTTTKTKSKRKVNGSSKNRIQDSSNNSPKVTRERIHTAKGDYNINVIDGFGDDGFEEPVVKTRKKYKRNQNGQDGNDSTGGNRKIENNNDIKRKVESHRPSNGMNAF